MTRALPAWLAALLLLAGCATVPNSTGDEARWRAHSADVTITRDDWGIAHVRGETDADAVFGMIYAQAEDDFNRIETNYLTNLGRLAEAEGESAIWSDLRMRLFLDHDDLRARYAAAPAWLQRLATAWADGLNFYLAEHPGTRPRVLNRFEPWMVMSFTEGSIGADFERVPLAPLEAFYSGRGRALAAAPNDDEPRGSNGIAIAPALTENGRALLLINPHTSFFFRSELQVTSGEGLNAYGAATWGQFFIYQGFNDRLGWMHTTSGLDVVDEFAETILDRGGRLAYRFGRGERPVETRTVTIAYRTAAGGRATRSFQTYRTHHGPVTREDDGRWIATALMHRPVEALSQAWLRTKARDFPSFQRALEFRANSSNNTLYADADGNIAYLHPQFIPRRDDRFDYTTPVDGSDPATDWGQLHALGEAPSVRNPPNGWVMNTNNWPYSAAGPDSPPPADFPRYMDTFGENARGLNALMLLQDRSGWTLERLRDAAFDSYQPGFAAMVPPLVAAFDNLPAGSAVRRRLAEPVAMLRGWDYRWGVESVPTSLAVFWAEALTQAIPEASRPARNQLPEYLARRTTGEQKLAALAAALDRLERELGSWRTPWGTINRFQRLTGAIVQPFSDSAPSIPVGFTGGTWGSLASFGSRPYQGTRRWYGTSGNSFVAVVEFGPRVRALAVTAGGESGNPASPHFNDQAGRYATGNLREVYFYPEQLRGRTERVYRPGD
ncbi:penicillin acylase family protein [Allosphingosinicella sp.]|uniref:penicillin acylase family protein n=1 Tax=Allosphingosinicella sp. TaxID=2823234 RepID=UPI002F0CACA4